MYKLGTHPSVLAPLTGLEGEKRQGNPIGWNVKAKIPDFDSIIISPQVLKQGQV
jgi:hypothetical protein